MLATIAILTNFFHFDQFRGCESSSFENSTRYMTSAPGMIIGRLRYQHFYHLEVHLLRLVAPQGVASFQWLIQALLLIAL
jgi:hypothetical protein